MLESCSFTLSLALCACFISPLHTRSAGSGVQVPTTDIPSGDTQVAILFPAGTNPVLHLKTISVPPMLMLSVFSMEPFRGPLGLTQLTEERKFAGTDKKICQES